MDVAAFKFLLYNKVNQSHVYMYPSHGPALQVITEHGAEFPATIQQVTTSTSYVFYTCFPMAQTVKNLPAMQETWVQSLGWEDSLEKGLATHSSTLPWTEEPGGLQPKESQRVGYN